MTRQEAIKLLCVEKSIIIEVDGNKGAEKMLQAYDMAIEALSADRPTGEWKGYNADNPDWLRKDGTPVFLVCDKCHDMVLNNSSTNWTTAPTVGQEWKVAKNEHTRKRILKATINNV